MKVVLMTILVLLIGCSPKLKTDKLYSYEIVSGESGHLGAGVIDTRYLYVESPKRILLMSAVTNSRVDTFMLDRRSRRRLDDGNYRYDFYRYGFLITIIGDENGEIVRSELCPNCDTDSSYGPLKRVALLCCAHKPKHCGVPLKEIAEITKKHKCTSWK